MCLRFALPSELCPVSRVERKTFVLCRGQTLRKTALRVPLKLGAKMVDFGWDMPVEYPSSGGLVKNTWQCAPAWACLMCHLGDILIMTAGAGCRRGSA
jgi:hypothetical protein